MTFSLATSLKFFLRPDEVPTARSVDRASEHPDLDQNALRIVEEVIMAAEVAVTTNLDKTKRFHGRVVQGQDHSQAEGHLDDLQYIQS